MIKHRPPFSSHQDRDEVQVGDFIQTISFSADSKKVTVKNLRTHIQVEIFWASVFPVGGHDICECQYFSAAKCRCVYLDFKKSTVIYSRNHSCFTSILIFLSRVATDERVEKSSTGFRVFPSNVERIISNSLSYIIQHNSAEFVTGSSAGPQTRPGSSQHRILQCKIPLRAILLASSNIFSLGLFSRVGESAWKSSSLEDL